MLSVQQLFRCAFEDDFTTFAAAFGSQVDDPVCVADHIQIMLNDNHSIACINQSIDHRQQVSDIGGMQANTWFIKNIDHID